MLRWADCGRGQVLLLEALIKGRQVVVVLVAGIVDGKVELDVAKVQQVVKLVIGDSGHGVDIVVGPVGLLGRLRHDVVESGV